MYKKTLAAAGVTGIIFFGIGCQAGFIGSTLQDEVMVDSEVASVEEVGAIDLGDEFVKLRNEQEDKEGEEQEIGIIPANLKIPSIEVDATVQKVGLLDNGQMGVPDNEEDVAWFEPGTKPGNKGNSVIAAHVDSREGPAVFWDLKKLETGDEIIVTDEEGSELTFVVNRVERYKRNEAPIEEIFGSADSKSLNLITCTGTFDRANGGHEERLVVYSELKDSQLVVEIEQPTAPTNVVVHEGHITFHAVREEGIVGYRVYRAGDDGEFEHVTSISSHQRKSYTDPDAPNYSYYVTSINAQGGESEPSEVASLDREEEDKVD